MYQECLSWSPARMPAAIPAGLGVDSTVSVSTRSGSRAAIAQASAPPQSWPTTCARSAPTSSRSAVTSPTISVMT